MTDEQLNNTQAQDDASASDEQGASTPSTFSQDDVNRIVKKRLAEFEASIVKGFGYDDVAKAKDALAKAKELELAQLSENERLKLELAEARKEAQEAQALKAQIQRRETLDKLAKEYKLPDVLKVAVVGDDEQAMRLHMEELVKTWQEAQAALAPKPKPPATDGAATTTRRDTTQVVSDERRADVARRFGIPIKKE